LQIVQEINSERLNLSRFGHFVKSIRKELCLLRSYNVVHVERDANLAADGLAR
jgi:hypothetical protein